MAIVHSREGLTHDVKKQFAVCAALRWYLCTTLLRVPLSVTATAMKTGSSLASSAGCIPTRITKRCWLLV